jgi:hypothetical protein
MNQETQTFERPRLDGIPIYVDGQLDRTHEIARYARLGLRLAGFAAYKGLEAISEMQASLDAPKKPVV